MKKATLVFIVREGKVLLGRKQGAPEIGEGTLNGPGGKLDPTDGSLIACVCREAREELGVELEPRALQKVGIITFFAHGEPSFEVHTYLTGTFKGDPRETPSMIPEWHDILQLPFDRMLEADAYWIPQLLRGETFNATVHYREKARGFIPPIQFFPFEDHE